MARWSRGTAATSDCHDEQRDEMAPRMGPFHFLRRVRNRHSVTRPSTPRCSASVRIEEKTLQLWGRCARAVCAASGVVACSRPPSAAAFAHPLALTRVHDIKGENWRLTAGWRSKFSHYLLFLCCSIRPTRAAPANPLLEVRKGPCEVRDMQNIARRHRRPGRSAGAAQSLGKDEPRAPGWAYHA